MYITSVCTGQEKTCGYDGRQVVQVLDDKVIIAITSTEGLLTRKCSPSDDQNLGLIGMFGSQPAL